jgi:septum site-determining protein MinC
MDSSFTEDEDVGFETTPPLHPSQASPTPIADSTPPQETEARSSVITARGTAEGLVLRIDGRVAPEDLLEATREFLESRRSFLQGNDVAFEWIGRKPTEEVVSTLSNLLLSEFKVSVRGSKLKTTVAKGTAAGQTPTESAQGNLSMFGGSRPAPQKIPTPEKNVSLFDGMDSIDNRATAAVNPMLWDEPDTRIVYGTLRSGQKVETEHSIVIFGDVNSGAEVVAGGDIVILGTLRGIAHAGAYDESGGGRVIFSLNLQPTQLRIGLVISRGSGSENMESTPRGGMPEVARVQGNVIVVEPYQSRTVWSRRRE